jgi:hypothetical protein
MSGAFLEGKYRKQELASALIPQYRRLKRTFWRRNVLGDHAQ